MIPSGKGLLRGNTVILDGSISDEEILGMIDHSYDCVVAGLGKAEQARLGGKPQKTKKPAKCGRAKVKTA